ncbi:MAG: FkbM family methyltransferase [Caulobacteraceae bacterium]
MPLPTPPSAPFSRSVAEPDLDRAAFRSAIGAADAERLARTDRLAALAQAKRAIVYSYGVRGQDLARQLRAAGVDCLIYDNAPSAVARAVADGFETTSDLTSPAPLIVAAGQNQVEILDSLDRDAFSLAEALYAFDIVNQYGRARAFTEVVLAEADALFGQYLTIEPGYRAAFLDVLLYRASLDVRHTDGSRRPIGEMWSPPPAVSDLRSFCDVGAYDGDTLVAMKTACPTLQRSFTVEPNPALAETIAATASAIGLDNTNFTGGAWRRRARLSVHHLANGMMAIQEDPRGEIQADTLDNLTLGETYDYVKLDIEGAESAALDGAAFLLRRAKCVAVASYHLPKDLIDLPRQMAALSINDRPWRCAFQHYSQSFDDSIYYFYQ